MSYRSGDVTLVTMGDIADWVNEQGEDAWNRHEAGDCEDGCPYCPDPEDEIQVRNKP